ncbi:MAG: alanine racemase [Actinomycetota bacterium]|nr:alanine racemase [Actinomycetota bacterium]
MGVTDPSSRQRLRPAWAEIDLDVITTNAAVLTGIVAPAELCAVVKADGYGHGAVPVAQAARRGGATWLGVALVEEGVELRDAGIDGPILVLSEPTPGAMAEVVGRDLTPTLYTTTGVEAAVAEVGRSGRRRPLGVHVKVDTGMHRVGAAPDVAMALALDVAGRAELDLDGFWTHFAVADEVDEPYTADQMSVFDTVSARLRGAGIIPRWRHAANSAGALWHPGTRLDLVRCGIALYGLAPCSDGVAAPEMTGLSPALSLRARVSHVKALDAGERLSYGLRYRLDEPSVVATVPLGYADGVPRSLSAAGGEVLIGGRRRRLAGTVTMDQVLVDCGPDPRLGRGPDAGPGPAVEVGDDVVLLGSQGAEHIGAWEWATLTGTISYEVVCGISQRVPRTYLGR